MHWSAVLNIVVLFVFLYIKIVSREICGCWFHIINELGKEGEELLRSYKSKYAGDLSLFILAIKVVLKNLLCTHMTQTVTIDLY